MVTEIAIKAKTSAKKRYLRRKKERRKQKGSGAHSNAGKDSDEVVLQECLKSVSDEQEEFLENATEEITQDQVEPMKEQKPRKRRKLQEPSEADEYDDVKLKDLYHQTELVDLQPELFPVPILPDIPSKSTLALQGTDRALIQAQIIHPSKTEVLLGGEDDGHTGLSRKTRQRLSELGVTELFAVQTALLPLLIPKSPLGRSVYLPYNAPRDICVSAPTGSGKTLAYVLPIIEVLSNRIVTRMRALIVLPTRDLVIQVKETFEAVGKGRGLKIGVATGQHSFAHEQSQLVVDKMPNYQGGLSKVDILICTPGRLIDHINGTPNFSLQHLRFLVIDEADRLLAQSFQDWVAQVLTAIRPRLNPGTAMSAGENMLTAPCLPYPDAVAPAFLQALTFASPPAITEVTEVSCQKLLFSATLTRDPGKIASLELREPQYFVVQSGNQDPGKLDLIMEKASVPSTLKEHFLTCKPSQKPLMFFHLVHAHRVTNALVFTKSADSTTRLVQLIHFFEKARTAQVMADTTQSIVASAYSSDLSPNERKAVLEKFKSQEIHILVCSDLISRGIDISHVSHVVSYDAPVDIRKYIHRVGRTARAGRSGDAWTLVEDQEAHYFKVMLKQANHLDEVKKVRVSEKEVEPLLASYDIALANLKDAYTRHS